MVPITGPPTPHGARPRLRARYTQQAVRLRWNPAEPYCLFNLPATSRISAVAQSLFYPGGYVEEPSFTSGGAYEL